MSFDVLIMFMPALFLAHMLGDFVFQSNKDVKNKRRLLILLKHSGIILALNYIFTLCWLPWYVPILAAASHFVIDFVKTRFFQRHLVSFLIDQCAHFLSYIIILMLPYSFSKGCIPIETLNPYFILLSGFIATTRGTGHGIGLFMQRLQCKAAEKDGLPNGGSIIGNLERALIFLLVLSGQSAGVGFLITAKSILRFGQINQKENREISEYIIIGTLLSFGSGLAISYLTLHLF